MLFRDLHAAVSQQERDLVNRNSRAQQFNCERVAEHVWVAAFRCAVGFLIFARLNSRRRARCHPFLAVSGSPLPLQKKKFGLVLGSERKSWASSVGSGTRTGTPVFALYKKSFPSGLSLSLSSVTASRMASPDHRIKRISARILSGR